MARGSVPAGQLAQEHLWGHAFRAMGFEEYQIVELLQDRPDLGLSAGARGTLLILHTPEAFEVEFLDREGRTIAVCTLTSRDVRSVPGGDPKHWE